MFHIKTVDKIKTHILCSITFFPENRAVHNNVEKRGKGRQGADDIIWSMLFACWITKATYTHSEHAVLIAFLQQQCFRERASLLRYTYIACLVIAKHGSIVLTTGF